MLKLLLNCPQQCTCTWGIAAEENHTTPLPPRAKCQKLETYRKALRTLGEWCCLATALILMEHRLEVQTTKHPSLQHPSAAAEKSAHFISALLLNSKCLTEGTSVQKAKLRQRRFCYMSPGYIV